MSLVFLVLISIASMAHGYGYFLWHDVLLKDGRGGSINLSYSEPYLNVVVKFGSIDIGSSKIKLAPAYPDFGRVRLYSDKDDSGNYVDFLEIGLVDGSCSTVGIYLDKDEISETQYLDCVVDGIVKRVKKPSALIMSFVEVRVQSTHGPIDLVYPYSDDVELPEAGDACNFAYGEHSIKGVVGDRNWEGPVNLAKMIKCSNKSRGVVTN